MNLRRPFDLVRIALLCTSVLFGLAACGDDDPSTPDACAGVECEFGGVCDPADGQCVNATSCESGEELCLQGYSCVDDTCIADIACPDEVCARGICRAGACINPPLCQTGQNCLDGFFCGDEGTCEADPCSETTCDRGVCEIGTGECVNQDFCTSATEDDVCLDGFRCLEGACQSEEAVCNDLDCQRGVCSFEELACIDADNCGNDMECLAGNYCADDNTCQPNLCDANGDCARGVCDPSSGQCVDADTCSSETDCVDGVVCISGECTANEEACGVDGCQGNQNCAYDDSTLSATCEESGEGCSQALDCLDDRICNAGACEEPVACEDDRFEPNDADGEETDYSDVNGGLPVDANICGGDVDRFAFDTTEDPDGTGELIFSVDIANSDVGLGTLSLELFDSTGASVGTAVTQDAMGNPTGSASITFTIDALNGGVFTGVVSDDGDVSTAGVNYSVRFDVVSADAVAACASPMELAVGASETGNSANGASSGLVASCGDADGTVPEDVWSFTLAEESLVDLVVAPLGNDSDLTLAIRTVCSQEQSEVACADERGTDGNEAIETILPAGTHYAVVQGDTAGDGGAYAITLDATPTVCSEGFQTCLDANDLEFCDATRTGFDTRTCQNGCDEDNDVCIPDQGNSCGDAFQVDINNPFNQVLSRARYQNDYDVGEGACVPDNTDSQASNGPDIALEATVPDGHVLVVQVEAVNSDDTSIYVVSDCDDISNTCLAGVNEYPTSSIDDERLVWENDTGQEVTVFAIVDSRDQTSLGNPRIESFVAPAVCTPGEFRCVLDRESQLCNEFGTGYDETSVCENGCDAATGECNFASNDLCGNATDVPLLGGTYNGDLALLTNSETDRAECAPPFGNDGKSGIASNDANEREAFYRVTTVNPNTKIEVSVDPTGFDPVIWVTDSCTADVAGACLGGVDDSEANGTSESMVFLAEVPGDYYFVVEPGDSGQESGTFEIEFEISEATCTPNEIVGCDGSGTIVGCDEFGQEFDAYTCADTCSGTGVDSTCDTATGDSCFDATTVDTTGGSDTISGTFDGTDQLSSSSGINGECILSSSFSGPDDVYAFDLSAGETLDLTLNTSAGSGTVYLMRDCGDFDTCVGNLGDVGGVATAYFAEFAQTVYVVVDSGSGTSSTATYSLSWEIVNGNSCAPGTTTCIDPNTSRACNDDGTSFTDTTCAAGCGAAGSCGADLSVGDSCDDAFQAGPGTYVIPQKGQTNTQSSSLSCLTSTSLSGEDYFIEVTVPVFSELSVDFVSSDSFYWNRIYLISDCSDPSGSCVAGTSPSSSTTSLTYVAGASPETLVIGLDTDGSFTPINDFIVTIDISPPDCTPGAAPTCNGNSLEVCDQGQIVSFSCSGGCSNGACGTPGGDVCVDALPVDTSTTKSGTLTGDWTDKTDTFDVPESYGPLCQDVYQTWGPGGPDVWYQFDLEQGEILLLDYVAPQFSSSFWHHIYVLDDCFAGESACVAAAAETGTDSAITSYFAETDQTVYVVVDGEYTTPPGGYEVDYQIQTNVVCLPGVTECSDANTLSFCNSSGSMETTVSCANGCVDGFCAANPPEGDLCSAPVTISGDTRIAIDQDDFTDDYEAIGCGASSSFPTDGEDVFYAVDLPANSQLEVTLTDTNGGFEYPVLHLFTDCSDIEGTCLTGNNSSGTTSISYFSPVEQTVLLGVDHEGSGNILELDIQIASPNCDPNTFDQACLDDDTGFEYCDANGFTQTYLCTDGCDPSTNKCLTPVGDTCVDPFDGNPQTAGTPEVFTNTLGDFTDVNDLGTGNSCTGSRTIGPDAVYAVDLIAGETLTVTGVSDEAPAEDIAIYAATGPCGEAVRDVCVAGSDVIGADSMDETFNYTATVDETIYVYVDSFFGGAAGDYTLTVDVSSP